MFSFLKKLLESARKVHAAAGWVKWGGEWGGQSNVKAVARGLLFATNDQYSN